MLNCPPDKILNPLTGRCVNINSAKGKQILKYLPIHLSSLKVIKKIGQGGLGEIVLIQDTITKKKFIRKQSLTNDTMSMLHQYQMLEKLKTKGICEKNFICPVVTYWEGSNFYIVFDYLEDYKTLAEFRRIDINFKKKISKDIIKLIKLLHKHNMVHVDIKPENIMVKETIHPDKEPTYHVRLIDFGGALYFKNSTTFIKIKAHTPYFLAPKIYSKGIYSFQKLAENDMWALGITLYEFLFNKLIFLSNVKDKKYKDDANKKLKNELNVRINFFPDSLM
jgi:serine/threonine protein kinase